jgi:transposase
MEATVLLSLPPDIVVMAVEAVTTETITLQVRSTCCCACCPVCGQPSTRIHSAYQRTVADLPCGAKRVLLLLHVHKFFCTNTGCPRKIFVQRITPFIAPWARKTERLNDSLQSIGLATCGKLGARLAQRLGMPTSWMTILRRILAMPSCADDFVLYLGIDDFAFRRGRRYGSILVNLDAHCICDLLPDRTTETATHWMLAHPEIDVVSRDRSSEYAAAIRQGAPHATQVADRFHMYKNLVEAVELTLARCRTEIRKAVAATRAEEAALVEPLRIPSEVVSIENWRPDLGPDFERKRQMRRRQRLDRYQQVMDLHAHGVSHAEIARRVGITVPTVEHWLNAGTFPEHKGHRKRKSPFDPYAAYVLQRWEQGCHNGIHLYQEIKAQGFTGSQSLVYRFLLPLRRHQQMILLAQVPNAPLQDFSAHDAVWLFVRAPERLDADEHTTLAAICQASETAQRVYELVQAFRQILHRREGERLDEWLAQVVASGIPELQSFVTGVERDKAAVQAGLTLAHSNGMVEGFVNKVKMVKRVMFGKAGFPLLRQRVLNAL